jgi:hypothetical protein
MKKNINLLFFINSLIGCLIFGQAPKGQTSYIDVKSPEAYAFEKYGNVPINLYTGSIDLKIPIASIDETGVSIPVTLNYDSSGFIPHKKADAGGVGWSVIAGGRITRKMNYIPDEYEGQPSGIGNPNPYAQSFNVHGFLKGVRMHASTNINAYNLYGGTGNTEGINWWMGPMNDGYEGEPDEFSFNVMGLSGKFVIGNDGNVLVESSDPNIKVNISQMATYGGDKFCTPPASLISLTDGNGNTYVFGGDMSKYELSYTYLRHADYTDSVFNGYPMISSFSLSKIIFANGKEINYSYEEGDLSPAFCYTDFINMQKNAKMLSLGSYSQDGSRGDWNSCTTGGFLCVSGAESSSSETNTIILLKKSVLKSIKYLDNEIKINYVDTGYSIKHYLGISQYLNEWVVDNVETFHNNTLVKKSQFSYDHLGGLHKRPFLKSVKDISSDQTYVFEYYKTNVLPAYYTKGIDHWGYWNSKDENTKLAPLDTYDVNTGNYELNNTFRDSNPQNYDMALLSKITYPTKGFSIFEYEPQYYGKKVERTYSSMFLPTLTSNITNGGLVGGARIHKISSYATNSTVSSTEKTYKYTTTIDGNASSGILMNWPRYFYYVQINHAPGMIQRFVEKTSSNVQENSLDSYNVGYSTVFEIESNKGYTEHNFTNYETHPDFFGVGEPKIRLFNAHSQSASFLPANLYQNYKNLYGVDKSILRGKLSSQKYFSKTELFPIKIVEYEYTNNMEFNSNSQLDNNKYVSINHASGLWIQAYKKYLNSSFLKKKITRDYLNTAEIKTTTDYIYDGVNHLNLSNERFEDTDGNIIVTKYKYAKDYGDGGDLNVWNFTGIPLLTTKYKNNLPISKSKFNFSRDWIGHERLLPLSQQSVINLDKIDTSSEIFEDQVSFGQYDNKGNLLEFTKKNGTTTTIIYGYNQTVPIAKIEGINYTGLMNLMGLSSNLTGYNNLDICQKSNVDNSKVQGNDETELLNSLDNFRKTPALADLKITTYTYDPLIGVRSITPPSGNREIYIYDSSRRILKIVDVAGRILKEYKYNYSGQQTSIFYNDELSIPFMKNNCPLNEVGGTYTYVVPAGKYSSDLSKTVANQMANDEINAFGQTTANQSTICYTKTNCPFVINTSLNSPLYSANIYTGIGISKVFFNLFLYNGNSNPAMYWNTERNFGKVSGSCIPYNQFETDYEEPNTYRKWHLRIDIYGNIYGKLISESYTMQPRDNININFEYSK